VSPIDAGVQARALELLRGLLRIDTTNPPGRERAAAEFLAESLREDGIEPMLLGPEKERTSLVARLKGSGEGSPLLVTAHLDVVPAEPSRWKHPPFGAEIDAGWLYGRGAVDMKNMAAMAAMTMKLLAREKVRLQRDVIFAAVADEEAGCDHGSRFLVDQHAEKVKAEFALGEIGGFTLDINGKRLYPIQIAQKGIAWVRARVEGTPGHGSMPREDNPVVRLSAALAKLTPDALPLHPTAPVRRAVRAMAAVQPTLARILFPLILNPVFSRRMLRALPDQGVARALNALLRNTATPTVLAAGNKTNVIPSRAEAEIDGRTLPGQSTDDFVRELSAVLGEGVTLEVLNEMAPVEVSPDTPMYRHLEGALRQMDPQGVPVPYVIPGFTDAGPFSRLGTTYYGFSPVVLPPSPKVSFAELYHGDNERIPVEGFQRGLAALYGAVRDWCAAR
jgi:acetylornithine deacetylase/succinyl-diaminopimelate desuccinylase-like protein